MPRRLVNAYYGALLAAALVCAAGADIVTLSDGSRLIGRVERLADGKLVLHTKFAGTIELDSTMITQIETDERVNVGMTSGDVLVGKVEWKPEVDRIVVQTEMGGIPILPEKIHAIWPEGEKNPELLALEQQMKKVESDILAKQPKWSATFEAGFVMQEGNTDSVDFRGKGELRRKSETDLLRFYVSGEYGENDDVRDAAEVIGGAYYEYSFTPRFLWFARGELEYDEFENLDLRATISTGPGFYWIREEWHELKTAVGPGFRHESFMDGSSASEAILDASLNYRLDIVPWLRFTDDLSYTPTFDEFRDYRLVNDSAITIPLGDQDMWKLKFGVLLEYDSLPQPGVERLDRTYYANLVLEIK